MHPNKQDLTRVAAENLVVQVKRALDGKGGDLVNPLDFINKHGGINDKKADGACDDSCAQFVVDLQSLYRRAVALPDRRNEVMDLLREIEIDLKRAAIVK